MRRIKKRDVTDVSHVKTPKGVKAIPLTQGRYALVDEEDFEEVMKYNWYCTKNGNISYAKSTIKHYKDPQYLHRFVMGERNPKQRIDHIDGDGLNCTKDNLRRVTHSQNLQNVPKRGGFSSSYKGVLWHKASKKWAVRIKGFGNNGHVGLYKEEEYAARVYDRVAMEVHGEYAWLNFPNDQDNTMTLNLPKPPKHSSKYRGVSWYKRSNKWKASIRHCGITYSLGYFDCEVEAAKAYDKKAKELYKEFAYLNFKD